jgi:hypothetical protein
MLDEGRYERSIRRSPRGGDCNIPNFLEDVVKDVFDLNFVLPANLTVKEVELLE